MIKSMYKRCMFLKQVLNITMLILFCGAATSAQNLRIDLSMVDMQDISPDNILNYQVVSNYPSKTDVLIKGIIRYRQSDLRIDYVVRTSISNGVNQIQGSRVEWQFSSAALRELFLNYKFLPQGTYEYCVSAQKAQSGDGIKEDGGSDCVFRQSRDLFLINLIEPENNAKLYEYNPLMSWMVNYPFGASLSYRVRVAEIKKGQSVYNAITRNNPVFSEKNVQGTSLVYPAYAKPLKTFQPYAWTVDAYYKGILIGGAEPWKFTIIEDTEIVNVPQNYSYFDFTEHHGESFINAVGKLKLKYVTRASDSLLFQVLDDQQKPIGNLPPLKMSYGDNLFALDLSSIGRHRKKYTLDISNNTGGKFQVPFIYYNPQYVR